MLNKILSPIVTLILLTLSISSPLLAAEPNTQVQISGPEPDLISAIPGCMPKAKASCQDRVVCTGISTIHGNNPRAVLTATKIARASAEDELARFYSNKKTAVEKIKSKDSTYEKEDGKGRQTQTQFGQLIETISNSSSEEMLQGVASLGGKIDLAKGTVTVVVGQGCDSVRTAKKLRGQMPKSQSSESAKNNNSESVGNNGVDNMGGPEVHHGQSESVTQKPSDDF